MDKIIVTPQQWENMLKIVSGVISQAVFVRSDDNGTGILTAGHPKSGILGINDAATLVLKDSMNWKIGQRKEDLK